jgi:acyl-CoA thioester hydrolase
VACFSDGNDMSTPRPLRKQFAHHQNINTRWTDNDIYGHVNNAIYYQYFDSVINAYLIDAGGLDIHGGPVVGFIVSSSCDFFAPVAYPAQLEVGVYVVKLGRSSVTYRTGVFVQGQDEACACGAMVHVFVDSLSQRPVDMPPALRTALQRLLVVE